MELLLVIYFLYARGPVPRGRINEELGETSQRKIKALLCSGGFMGIVGQGPDLV